MKLYGLSKKEFKELDKEFGKTEYGKLINMVNLIPLMLGFVCLGIAFIFMGIEIFDNKDFLIEAIVTLIISFFMFSFSAITNILSLKELRRYIENKK